MDRCDLTSSQFDLCIESSKKIVKKKKRIKLGNSVTGPWHRDSARLHSSPVGSPGLPSRIAHLRGTSMNTGDLHHQIFSRQDREWRSSFFVEDCARFHRTNALKFFFERQRNSGVLRTFLRLQSHAMQPQQSRI